jgi:hypothetical protein
MPDIRRLAMMLNNIPASSAYIERHFSICGAICNQRRSNMTPEQRALIKANMGLLEQMNAKPAVIIGQSQ